MGVMVEWPGRCRRCGEAIEDWSAAGFDESRWVHKRCHLTALGQGQRGDPSLRSPVERSAQLELPMLVFLLLFHFGLGGAVIGWILMTQHSETAGAIVLAIGMITPLIGVAGVAVNIISRHRIELIRRALDLQGGWRPGL
jgi:hypothetical protein